MRVNIVRDEEGRGSMDVQGRGTRKRREGEREKRRWGSMNNAAKLATRKAPGEGSEDGKYICVLAAGAKGEERLRTCGTSKQDGRKKEASE